jgi:hypothetical protein
MPLDVRQADLSQKQSLPLCRKIGDNRLMQRLIHRLVLIVVLTSTLADCGGSTTGDADGGPSNAGGSAAVGGGTGNSCDVVTVAAANVQICATAAACVKSQCNTALTQCLGADYLRGNYGASPCAEYANCVNGCNCVKTCSDACGLSSACQTCLTGPMLTCAIQSCAAAYVACTR